MGERTEFSGRCLCGAVELCISGRPLSVSYCHCASCRRATGGPVSVFVGFNEAQVSYPREAPQSFSSSAGIDRPFCRHCGSRVAYTDAQLPGRIYFHIGIFDRPELFVPECHAWEQARLSWLHIADRLPRHYGSSVSRP